MNEGTRNVTRISYTGPNTQAPDPDEHGPLRADRIRSGDYTAKFLSDLKDQVMPVEENWNSSRSSLPPRISWVIYPNGDLERIGFD
jgi:hypothetical protein